MSQTLQQRHLGYEQNYNQNIIARIPIIIKIDGRSFSRVTKNLEKPLCLKTMGLFQNTMISLAKQIDGVLFGYQYSDKIFLILRNDRSNEEEPWFGNNIQKLSSVSASMATYEFLNHLWSSNDPPSLEGSITFSSHAFAVPNITEVINYLIYRQFCCIQNSINESVHSVLWPKYGNETPIILEEKGLDERQKILNEFGFDFELLPNAYRLGSVGYIIPTLVNTSQGQITRQKWILDNNYPLFNNSKEQLRTILSTGSDIFRPGRDLNDSI
jgi:tRNA(His) 5'-end guanylyltransferase